MRKIVALTLLLLAGSFARESNAGVCQGAFANPVTDICWKCLFPLTIGGVPLDTEGQIDTPNPPQLPCTCPQPVRIGVTTGFWEPARRVDVTRTPYCFVSLGGVSMNPGLPAPEGEIREQEDLTKQSKYQLHWYADPILYWLQIAMDDPCLEEGQFDVGYITEVDPTWDDDELTILLDPESALFGNPIAQAACAGDCVMATAAFGSNAMFWCAGCNGSVYPLNGHVQAHVSEIQASLLLVQRLTMKMHRQMMTFATWGEAGLCGPYPDPVMDKTQYKTTMLYPVPETGTTDGKCCETFGASSAVWGAGKAYPYSGEDFSY